MNSGMGGESSPYEERAPRGEAVIREYHETQSASKGAKESSEIGCCAGRRNDRIF